MAEISPDPGFNDPATWQLVGGPDGIVVANGLCTVTNDQQRELRPKISAAPDHVAEVGVRYEWRIIIPSVAPAPTTAAVMFGGVDIYRDGEAGMFTGSIIAANTEPLRIFAWGAVGWVIDYISIQDRRKRTMSVPESFFQGDTVSWEESLSAEYPASEWTLTYDLLNAAGKITVVAVADGDDYQVDLTAAMTQSYIPGEYTWVGKVTDTATGLISHTVLAGRVDVFRDLSDLNHYDARTWAEIALENVEAVITNRATVDQEAYSIQGRSLSRTPLPELVAFRKYLQGEVSKEKDLVSSGPSSKMAHVRF